MFSLLFEGLLCFTLRNFISSAVPSASIPERGQLTVLMNVSGWSDSTTILDVQGPGHFNCNRSRGRSILTPRGWDVVNRVACRLGPANPPHLYGKRWLRVVSTSEIDALILPRTSIPSCDFGFDSHHRFMDTGTRFGHPTFRSSQIITYSSELMATNRLRD